MYVSSMYQVTVLGREYSTANWAEARSASRSKTGVSLARSWRAGETLAERGASGSAQLVIDLLFGSGGWVKNGKAYSTKWLME